MPKIWGIFFSLIFFAAAARAESLDALFDKLLEDPTNLELNFAYANKAIEENDLDAAMATYERMLIISPNLSRIKLDLAALHMRLTNYELAKELFNEVLETDPPTPVVKNIQTMLQQIKKEQKKHFFTGAASVGYNSDSNANSASADGFVLFQGIELPLDNASLDQQDDAKTFSFAIGHRYAFSNQDADQWKSQYLYYRSRQSNLTELDLDFHSFSTGPVLNLPAWGLSINPSVTYNYITLGHKDYQEAVISAVGLQKNLSEKVQINSKIAWENRHYFNTADNTSLTERNGDAFSWLMDLRYAFTPKDILSLSYKFQQEDTRRGYYSNKQNSLNFSYTRMFTPSLFAAVNFYIKATDYKTVDAFVDPSTIREDTERGSSVTVGKTFGKLSASVGYIWKDVNSNISNYTYDNERISANLGWKF